MRISSCGEAWLFQEIEVGSADRSGTEGVGARSGVACGPQGTGAAGIGSTGQVVKPRAHCGRGRIASVGCWQSTEKADMVVGEPRGAQAPPQQIMERSSGPGAPGQGRGVGREPESGCLIGHLYRDTRRILVEDVPVSHSQLAAPAQGRVGRSRRGAVFPELASAPVAGADSRGIEFRA